MIVEHIRTWYGRFERPISSLSLILGFVFDAVTLKRVDMFWENFWIIAHLVIVGVVIALIHTHENSGNDEANVSKAHFWYVNILQFFFGGIFSTYLVLYFRSADLFVTWPFILILAIAFVANESLKRHYVRLSFQIGLFFLSVYSFAIFLVPVLLHNIGDTIFILSGVLSLLFIGLYILLLFFLAKEKFSGSKRILFFLITGIFAVVNVLYFTNLIPPIPLSLKDAGVYHGVQKNADGNYAVSYEDLGLAGYFSLYPKFHEVAGDTVYAYSAIFSPSNLNTTIIHEWQYYDGNQKSWVTVNEIALPVVGGRDGGFRTYSSQSNVFDGNWRVNIKTTQGQLIGRLRFSIVQGNTQPALVTDIK